MKNSLRIVGLAAGLFLGAPALASSDAVLFAPDVQATDDGQTDDLPLDALIAPRAAGVAPVPAPYTFAPQIADSPFSVAPEVLPAAAPMPDAAIAAAFIPQAEEPGDKLGDAAPIVASDAVFAHPPATPTMIAEATAAPSPVEVSEAAPSSVLKTLDGKPWSPVRTFVVAGPVIESALTAASAAPELHLTDAAPVALARTSAPEVGPSSSSAALSPPPPEAPVKIVIEASVVSPATSAATVIIPVSSPAVVPTTPLSAPLSAAAPPKPVRTPLAPPRGFAEAPEATLQDAAFIARVGDSAPVDWRTIISQSDKDRLAKLSATRRAAIKQAEAAIDAGNKAAIAAAPSTSGLLYATAIVASEADVMGEYRCRTTALGGPAPKLVLYKYATCRIEQWPNGSIVIEKTSGADRFIGRLWREPDSTFIYLGANFPEEGAVWAYNEDPAQNQVGRLYRIGANRLRLELPRPSAGTALNVVDFVRQK